MRTLRTALLCPWLLGCQPAEDAPRVELPLVVDERGIESLTTELGYEVTLSAAQLVVRDFQFTTAGELHAAHLPERLWALFVPRAQAHPGHYEGGEVIGEARGRFVVDWLAEDHTALGTATLIVGSYTSANFTFDRAGDEHDLGGDDRLRGHTARFVGVASKAGTDIDFELVVDSPEDRQLVGAPFESEITKESELLIGFSLATSTLFDGLDFATLDTDEDGAVYLGPSASSEEDVEAYNLFRRTFQTHDHYGFRAIPVED